MKKIKAKTVFKVIWIILISMVTLSMIIWMFPAAWR